MARDVEFNVTANDRTGNGLASAEAKFKASQRRIESSQKASLGKVSTALLDTVGRVSPKLQAKLTEAFAGSAAEAGPILAGAAAVAAPLIGGLLSAAVIGGSAGLGLVGGVVLASKDARVQAAGKALGQHLLSSLHQDSSVFIQPLLNSVDTLEKRFDGLRPTIQRLFSSTARYVEPLTNSLADAASSILDGVTNAAEQAGPVMAAFGRLTEGVGDAIGDAFTELSKNADVGASSVDDITNAIVNFVHTTAGVIDGLAAIKRGLDQFDSGIDSARSGIEDFFTKLSGGRAEFDITADGMSVAQARAKGLNAELRRTGSGTFGVAAAFQQATEDTYDYAAGLAAADKAVEDVYRSNNDLYSSTTSVGNALAAATEAAKKNGQTLSANTVKGRANRDALSNVAGALQKNYDAYVKVNGAGAGASALASTLRGKFVALAEKLGASKSAANRLANSLLNIPNVSRKVSVATAAASAAADALKRKLAGIKDRQVYVKVAFNEGRINKVENQLNRLGSTAFDANDSFGISDRSGDSGSRTGGPTPVTVNQSLSLSLDGAPFKAYTARQIQAETDRTTWRQRVGVK